MDGHIRPWGKFGAFGGLDQENSRGGGGIPGAHSPILNSIRENWDG